MLNNLSSRQLLAILSSDKLLFDRSHVWFILVILVSVLPCYGLRKGGLSRCLRSVDDYKMRLRLKQAEQVLWTRRSTFKYDELLLLKVVHLGGWLFTVG